jgi:peptide/nickel transport system permease protein
VNTLELSKVQEITPAPKARKSVLQRVWRDRVAQIALSLLALAYMGAALADPLAPYSMNFNDADLANAPPSIVHFRDAEGKLTAPFVYSVKRLFDADLFKQIYLEDRSKPYAIKWLVDGEPYNLFGIFPCTLHLFGVDAPARVFLLGSDINGRDNFSRLFFGAQKSLTIGFLGLFVAFPIGILYGGISGFIGGLTDTIMMRVAEAIISIPSFYLLVALSAVLPPGLASWKRFALITLILSFIGWASFARVIRGMVLSIREQEFVQAALALGMSPLYTILKHVIPQTASVVIISATLQVPYFILSESGLSFIGLGIQQPDASWGNMLTAALDNANDLFNQYWLLAPGFLIFLTVLCFNSVGDVLRDVLDPKQSGSA